MAMLLTTSGTSSFSVALPDEQATRRLATDIANSLAPLAPARPRSRAR
jgi:hypothetical protein